MCVCEPGFDGIDCAQCIEGAHGCHEHASCRLTPDGVLGCECDRGYSGDGVACVPVCNTTCGLHGVCAAPDTCACEIGWTGAFCQDDCGCLGHSTCDSGIGHCDACQHNTAGARCEQCAVGFYGNATDRNPFSCQPCPCSGHGTCDTATGACVCDATTEGTHCDTCRDGYYGSPADGSPCLAYCTNERNRIALTEPEGWLGSGPARSCNQGSGSMGVACYAPSVSCFFAIIPQRPGQHVQLTFDTFDTECGYDYVTLFEGLSSHAPAFGAVSGPAIPAAVRAHNGSGLLLHWYSDVSWVLRGFRAHYRLESCPGECSGHGTCGLDGVCRCMPGWLGDDCSREACPNNCSLSLGQGVCDVAAGLCRCQAGYEGTACERNVAAGGFTTLSSRLPLARASHAVATLPGGEMVAVFGGRRSGPLIVPEDASFPAEQHREAAFLSDLLAVNITSGHVHALAESTRAETWPAGRHGHTLVAVGDALYLFGGKLADSSLSGELWRYELNTAKWTRVNSSGQAAPEGRFAHCAVAVGTDIYVIGGLSSDDGYTDVTWRYKTGEGAWEVSLVVACWFVLVVWLLVVFVVFSAKGSNVGDWDKRRRRKGDELVSSEGKCTDDGVVACLIV